MLRLVTLFLVSGLLLSCASRPRSTSHAVSTPPHSKAALHSYSLGMSRREVRADLSDSWLLVSASRPVTGWSSHVLPPAGGRAVKFERSHEGSLVEKCDVYWVGHTNAPKMNYGIWLNYFYFDGDDKLIGFDRWVIDNIPFPARCALARYDIGEWPIG